MLHAVTGLRARGHTCELAAPAEPTGAGPGLLARACEREIEPVLRLEVAQGYRPWRDGGEVARLRALLVEGRYDLVHAHHTRDFFLCRAAARSVPGLRRVLSWHHGDPIAPRPWNRWLYGPAALDGLTVLSGRLRKAAAADLGWPDARVLELPGVVDTDRFAPRPASKEIAHELGLTPENRVLGIVARLQPHRRFELLLEAVGRLRSEFPSFRLLVVGRGTRAREVLEEPVARLGLGGVVVRAGYRRDDYLDVLSVMQGLVFLVPGSDGSCRALLEAMAMGIPAIASRRGVLPDMVEDGSTGRLVDETPESLLAVLREFCREPERWAARGQAARRHILATRRIAQHAERLEAFYRTLLSS